MSVEASTLGRYLQVLTAEAAPDRLVEIRYRLARGMGQRFISAAQPGRLESAIRELARERDTHIGVLLRDRASGGRQAVPDGRLVWADVDIAAAGDRLERAPAPPTLTVASGTPGHLHAYWQLSSLVSGEEIEAANRRLAHAVGGDLASVDRARILRPPETLSFKTNPPRLVTLESLASDRLYDLNELVDGLEDPTPAPPAPRAVSRQVRRGGSDWAEAGLRAIPGPEFVERLCGRVPDRSGKVLCPFHEERTPSLQVYPDGSWCCFGCRRGGSIVDFAAAVWGRGTKGRDFIQVRERLINEFLGGRPEPTERSRGSRRMPAAQTSPNQEVSR